MHKLAGKVVLVAGGAGEVGEGLVRTFLKEDATVVVPSRSKEKLLNLQDYCRDIPTGRLLAIYQNIGDISGANRILARIQEEFGKLDIVVVSLGGGWPSIPLLQIQMNDWQKAVNDYLLSHITVSKVFMPYLLSRKSGHYLMINGGASEQLMYGWAPVSMMAAAQLMLSKGLAMENKGKGVEVHTISLFSPIITRARGRHIKPEWLRAEQVGEYIIDLTEANEVGEGEVIHRLYPHTAQGAK